MVLMKDKQYVFKVNDYFDIVYYNGFIVKSKVFDFEIGEVLNSKNEELIVLLNSFKYEGQVLFDLLASHGAFAHNRFIKVDFLNGVFSKELETFKIADPNKRKIQDDYYNSAHVSLKEIMKNKEERKKFKTQKYHWFFNKKNT